MELVYSQPTVNCANGSVQRFHYEGGESAYVTIAPAGASTVTLSFSAFSVSYYDRLTVYECADVACSVISDAWVLGWISAASAVTSRTGIMKLWWRSEASGGSSGWRASWMSGNTSARYTSDGKAQDFQRSHFWLGCAI